MGAHEASSQRDRGHGRRWLVGRVRRHGSERGTRVRERAVQSGALVDEHQG